MKNMSDLLLDRRQVLGLGLGSAAALALAGCSGGSEAPTPASSSSSDNKSAMADIDAAAFDALLAAGPVADDADVSASTWASAVKKSGTLRVGGVATSALFALLNEKDNHYRGFDAGLYQLLARYITGDETKFEVNKVTSDTRESVLINNQVDAVFATYTITPAREEIISFAGPYYSSQYSVMVAADNSDINGVDDLADKSVAAQSGSTGPQIVAQFAPDAKVQEFTTDEEARTALAQGRVDAYVYDDSMQRSSIVKNPGKYRIAGGEFGPTDNYGVGLPKDSDGVAFINAFLQKIEDDGTWAKLWKIGIGDRTGTETAPEPPAIVE